jgi:pyridoxine 5-phosphate synthase
MSGVNESTRLGVNIDHVATLRQARGEKYPSLKTAAEVSIENGADQITIHLRSDRRHIQDYDVNVVHEVVKEKNSLLNFEIGATQEMISKACVLKPDWVCFVPEKREERTTEGGLNLTDQKILEKLIYSCEKIKESSPSTKISLFVESDQWTMDAVLSIKKFVDAVEIHTGEYAIDVNKSLDTNDHIDQYRVAKRYIEAEGLGFHAGHGLTNISLKHLADLDLFSEYNIGHWIISQSVFDGLGQTVRNLKNIIEKNLLGD